MKRKLSTLKPRLKPLEPRLRATLSTDRITGSAHQKIRKRILMRDEYTCRICGKTLDERYLIVDHICPLADGGREDDSNRQLLCISPAGGCHKIKTDRENKERLGYE